MDSLNDYLLASLPKAEDWMISLEAYAKNHRVPIMEPVSMNFLAQLVCIKRPQRILEIGSAIGYSALRMHHAFPSATIMTIEKNKKMCLLAEENIKKMNKENEIEVLCGDASDMIDLLSAKGNSFDFIFIDAAKGQYKRYFELVQPLIERNGIIVCDNILFKGYVADATKDDNNRLQNIGEKVRGFNEWLMQQKEYHTSIVPIGDGLSISLKNK